MIHAIVHGKVPESVRAQEDVLTSCVFGALDILPARLGLRPWLQCARALDGRELRLSDEELDTRTARFWPRLALHDGTVEPDLHLQLSDRDIVIEVKYGAGPSGSPTNGEQLRGQLGRQWAAARASLPQDRVLTLLYVTADWTMPRPDMEAMVRELEEHDSARAVGFRYSLYWLSWRSLARALTDVDDRFQARTLALLRAFLAHYEFNTFHGVQIPPLVRRPSWTYGTHGYTWQAATPAINWSYASDQPTR